MLWTAELTGSCWYGHFYFLHFDLSEFFCQLPANYTSTASYISKGPITPGLIALASQFQVYSQPGLVGAFSVIVQSPRTFG